MVSIKTTVGPLVKHNVELCASERAAAVGQASYTLDLVYFDELRCIGFLLGDLYGLLD